MPRQILGTSGALINRPPFPRGDGIKEKLEVWCDPREESFFPRTADGR